MILLNMKFMAAEYIENDFFVVGYEGFDVGFYLFSSIRQTFDDYNRCL